MPSCFVPLHRCCDPHRLCLSFRLKSRARSDRMRVRQLYYIAVFTAERDPMKVRIRKSNIKRVRMCGFRARMRTRGGRAILKRRRQKGRKKLTPI